MGWGRKGGGGGGGGGRNAPELFLLTDQFSDWLPVAARSGKFGECKSMGGNSMALVVGCEANKIRE